MIHSHLNKLILFSFLMRYLDVNRLLRLLSDMTRLLK